MVPWAQVPKIFESQTIISLGCIQLKSVTSLASGGTYGHQITDISAKTSSVHQSGFFSPIFNRYLHVTKTPNKKFIRCQTIPERFQECILTNAFHLCCPPHVRFWACRNMMGSIRLGTQTANGNRKCSQHQILVSHLQILHSYSCIYSW